jgi:hypothetical protein
MGRLNLDGGIYWETWDTDYPTVVSEDFPYEFDMINEFDVFTVHSPIIFLPLITNN